MDLNRLATFVQVVELRSFTAAANALGVRKSSVSRSVSALEEELGTALLVRTTRKLSLTDAGKAYYEVVRQAIGSVSDATASMRNLGKEPRGYLRITAAPNFDAVAVVLAQFVRKYPKIQVEACLTSRAVDLVEERFDFALRGGQLIDSTLVGRKLAPSLLALYASPDYLSRHGIPHTYRELGLHACVCYRATAGRGTWRMNGPDGPETVEVRASIIADDMAFATRAAVEGAGIGMLVHSLARGPVQRGELVRVLSEYAIEAGGLYLVWPASRHPSAAATLLRDFIIENLAIIDPQL